MSSEQLLQKPDIKLSVKQTFGFDSEMKVGAFSKKNEYVPKIDPDYKFDKDTTLAILAGFSFNKRVLIQGLSWNRKVYSYRTSCSEIKLAMYQS